ncbi:MAG: SDR family NAD(P)-dependent oxidoreductase [Chloroflexi bacterium]|nr:SDR family NAD(P)-dependent oxidoreductase [Chloroflexota bacterium]
MSERVPSLTPAGVWLVSGGAKGVTAQCVIRLASQYRAKFILLGRSELTESEPEWAQGVTDEPELKRRIMAQLTAQGEKPTPVKIQKEFATIKSRRTIEETISAITEAGGQALYCQADVTDRVGLAAQLENLTRQTGAITAVLHGAGNLADKLIEQKTEKDFETVYAAKVEGLANLLACVPPGQLDTLVLFSSAAGFYGNPGQSDYALANEILNKTAHLIQRTHPHCHVISLNWGPWDGGMVTPALRTLFAERHIDIIPIDSGAQMLVDELEQRNSTAVQVLIGSAMTPPADGFDPLSPLITRRVQRTLSLAANPFLLDHMIGGQAVLPTVCALAWMGNTAEQLYPGYTFFRAENYRVLKGIVFDETLAPAYTVEVKEVNKTVKGQLQVDVLIASQTPEGKPRYHYNVRLHLGDQVPVPPRYAAADLSAMDARPGIPLYTDGTLFHGPSFQGVRRIMNYSPQRLTLECEMPSVSEAAQGQFPIQSFNPFLADVQFQSMVIWARLFYGAGSLPLRAQSGEHYRVPAPGEKFYVSLEVRSHSESNLVADIIATDAAGEVYTRVDGAEVTISVLLNRLFTPSMNA